MGTKSKKTSPVLLQNSQAQLDITLDFLIAHLQTLQTDCFFVQVGAYDGISGDSLYPLVKKYGLRGLLIEPQKQAFAKLQLNYQDQAGLIFKNVAIANFDGTKELYFIKPNSNVPESFYQLTSFDRQHLAIQLNIIQKSEEMIAVDKIPCLTFDTLFKQLDIERVDLLQIDAEGYDNQIINLFDFARFKPAIVRFEHLWLTPADWDECLTLLIAHGYKITHTHQDTIAYLF